MLRMKSVFITGSTSGIGWDLAKLYLGSGCRVAVCGRDLTKLPENLNYPHLVTYELDVTDKAKCREAINDFSEKGLDLVIANAGISHGSKSAWPDEDATDRILATNISGVVNTLFPAIDYFKKTGVGHIAAVASVAGFVGLPGAGAYSASKSAVIQMMESFSLSLPKFGIEVTTICPGFIDTPLTQKNDHSMPFLMPSEKGARMIKKALDKRQRLLVFPWQMSLVIHLLKYLPRTIYRFMMNLPFANYSK